MRATIEARDRSMLIQAIRAMREREPARTGVHCSTIVNSIIQSMDASNRKRSPIDEATMLSFQEVGNVVEDIIAEGLNRRYPGWTKPKPRTHRGVICSPDGFSPRANCIDEVKALWKSECSREDGPFITLNTANPNATRLEEGTGIIITETAKFIGYKIQVLFYMKAWDAIRSRLHALFMNGNYRPPFPDPITIRLRPSRRELDDNEDLVLSHGHDMGLLK